MVTITQYITQKQTKELKTYLELSGYQKKYENVRDMEEFFNHLILVIGDKVCAVNKKDVLKEICQLKTSEGIVSMVEDGVKCFCVCDGVGLYIIEHAEGNFNLTHEVSDPWQNQDSK